MPHLTSKPVGVRSSRESRRRREYLSRPSLGRRTSKSLGGISARGFVTCTSTSRRRARSCHTASACWSKRRSPVDRLLVSALRLDQCVEQPCSIPGGYVGYVLVRPHGDGGLVVLRGLEGGQVLYQHVISNVMPSRFRPVGGLPTKDRLTIGVDEEQRKRCARFCRQRPPPVAEESRRTGVVDDHRLPTGERRGNLHRCDLVGVYPLLYGDTVTTVQPSKSIDVIQADQLRGQFRAQGSGYRALPGERPAAQKDQPRSVARVGVRRE